MLRRRCERVAWWTPVIQPRLINHLYLKLSLVVFWADPNKGFTLLSTYKDVRRI